jgi:hypothetical protein
MQMPGQSYSSGPSPFWPSIHRSAWKGNSTKFACDKATSPQPTKRNAHPNSRAATINAMPIVATFHTSERISGTPAA